MDLIFIAALLLVLVIVTVVGHGIWVLVATIFKAALDDGSSDSVARAREARRRRDDERLRSENVLLAMDAASRTIESLQTLQVQLGRWLERDLIDRAVYSRLSARVSEELRFARGEAPAPASPRTAADVYAGNAPVDALEVVDELGPGSPWRPAPASPSHAAPLLPASPADVASGDPSSSASRPAWLQDLEDYARHAPPLEIAAEGPQDSAPEISPVAPELSPDGASEVSPNGAPELSPDLAPEYSLAAAQASTAERVERFMARQASAPAPAAAPPPEAPPDAWTDLFAAFMEEKNIRWGELVGGLLIVGCSIALVISFWAQIAERPLLKFLVFNGVTASLFGVGLYSEHRWRLRTTSQGLLIIATLLTPLNFLAIAAFHRTAPSDFLMIAGELASIALFAGLLHAAGRILVPGGSLLLAIGVLAPSVMQLLTRRFVEPDAQQIAALLGLATLAVVGAMNGMLPYRIRGESQSDAKESLPTPEELAVLVGEEGTRADERNVSEPVLAAPAAPERDTACSPGDAEAAFRLLGLSGFAAALTIGLLCAKLGPLFESMHRLAVVLTAAGVTPLLAGLFYWRRLSATKWPGHSVAALSIGVGGALVMAGAVAVAWPTPSIALPSAALAGVALTMVAFYCEIPVAHLAVAFIASMATLVVAALLAGDLDWSNERSAPALKALLAGRSSGCLTLLAIVYAGAWFGVHRLRRRDDARFIAAGGIGIATVSLALTTWFGFGRWGDPHHATLVYGFYAIAAYFVARQSGNLWALAAAAALVLVSSIQGAVYWLDNRPGIETCWTTGLLVAAGIWMLAAAAICRWEAPARREPFAPPLMRGAAWLAALVTLSLIFTAQAAWPGQLVESRWGAQAVARALTDRACLIHWLGLAGLWLGLAGWSPVRAHRSFAAFEGSLAVAIAYGVAIALKGQAWFMAARDSWGDPWAIIAMGIALAAQSLLWIAARWLLAALATRRAARASLSAGSAHVIADRAAQGDSATLGDSAAPDRHLLEAVGSWRLGSAAEPPWPAVDFWMRWIALAAFVMLAIYAAYPGVVHELSPASLGQGASVANTLEAIEIRGAPHDHARGWGMGLYATLLVASVGVAFVIEGGPELLLGALALFMAFCPLLASFWQNEVATASALRWLSAGSVFVVSAPVWGRRQVLRLATLAHWKWAGKWRRLLKNANWLMAAALVFTLAPQGAIGLRFLFTAPGHTALPLSFEWLLSPFGLAAALIAAGIGALSLGMWPEMSTEMSAARSDSGLDVARREMRRPASLAAACGVIGAAMLLFFVVGMIVQMPITGVNPASVFGRMGPSASYATPLALVALALVGYAIRERSDRFAQAACLVAQLAAIVGYGVVAIIHSQPWGWASWLRAAQLNAIVAGLTGLVWLAVMAAWARRTRHDLAPAPPLLTQLSLPFGFNLLALAPAWCAIAVNPMLGRQELAPIVDLWSWAAIALALVASLALMAIEGKAGWKRQGVLLLPWLPFALGALVAATVGAWRDVAWAAFHALATYQAAFMAALAAGLALRPLRRAARAGGDPFESAPARSITGPLLALRRRAARPLFVAVAITAFLALRAAWDDPQPLLWSCLPLLAIGGALAVLAVWLLRPGLLYLAAAAFNMAASLSLRMGFTGLHWAQFEHLARINVIALAAPTPLWVALERRVFRRAREALVDDSATEAASISSLIPIHRLAAWLSLLTMAAIVIGGLATDVNLWPQRPDNAWQWGALIATLLAGIAYLWDTESPDVLGLFYLDGLLLLGGALDSLNLSLALLEWLSPIFLAGYNLVTSYLWSRRSGLRELGERIGIARRGEPVATPAAWIVAANLLLAAAAIALAFKVELTFAEARFRLLVANAVVVQPMAVGLLARGARRSALQSLALALGAVAAVSMGWAPLAPGAEGELLDRMVVVLAALVAMAIVYGFTLAKFLPEGSEWLGAAQRMGGKLMIGAAVSATAVLGAEVWLALEHGLALMAPWAIGLVAMALLGSCAAAIAAAVLPGRDPLGLSDRGRQAYVYGAEVCLGLLFVHIRLTMPWLFAGVFARYWPLIVMLIAYLGAGVGERLRRSGLTVLGEPLENTGALLPLMPVVGFWILPPSGVDFSLLLLVVGLLYFGLSVARKSFGFGILAAFAANGSLWCLLERWEGYRLLDHPQLWLIPPALSVLIAAQLTKRQLTAAQMTSIRYACGATIYVSSTADIFLRGVAEAPWLPFVLGGLSILGVLAGIWLRVRAFLFLGVAFLLVSLLTIIWHAAVDLEMTWLWSVTGIVAGALIIAMFAIFEKRRDALLDAVEQLKKWQG